MSAIKTGRLLGIAIGEPSLAEATARALAAIDRRHPPFVFATAMAHSVNVAQDDPEFAAALDAADMVVADGVGVYLSAKLVGIDVGSRIAGEQMFRSIMDALQRRGHGRIFFFGASQQTLQRIANRMPKEWPALTLAGILSPPYRPWSAEENRQMLEAINSVEPDVLWVGLGAPKQEKWVYRNVDALKVPFVGSIGAVFDYFAGVNPSPPAWVRRFGLETPYRLSLEPRRLWRRAILSNGQFVGRVLWRHVLHRRKRRPA